MGIALVFVLDVAFIWLMSLETEVPEIAQIVIPNAETPVIRGDLPREPVANVELGETVDRRPNPSMRVDLTRQRSGPESAATKLRKTGADEMQVPVLDAKRLFPDKIIYYGNYETTAANGPTAKAEQADDPAETELEQAPAPLRSGKRSFKSRAFGVIKKPYNVIKKPFKWIGSAVVKVGGCD